jgi:hypothetical protein
LAAVGRRGLLNCEILLGRRFGADEGFDVCGGLYAGNVLKLQSNRVETHEEIHFLLVHHNRIAPCGICCCTFMTYSQDVLTLKTDEFVDKLSSQRHSWKTSRRRHVLQVSRIRLACCGMPSSPACRSGSVVRIRCSASGRRSSDAVAWPVHNFSSVTPSNMRPPPAVHGLAAAWPGTWQFGRRI